MASSRPVSQNLWVRPIAALRWPASSFIGAGPRVSKVCTTHNVLPQLVIVDRLQRNRLADDIGIELGQLRGGVDRGADDADLPDDELGLGAPRPGFDTRHRDGRTAWLRQPYRWPFESLALPARLVAGRNDLRAEWNDLRDGGE